MARDGRLWLLFLGIAIALTIACGSSTTTPGGGDAEVAADSMTQG
jgi:hypothetical protein